MKQKRSVRQRLGALPLCGAVFLRHRKHLLLTGMTLLWAGVAAAQQPPRNGNATIVGRVIDTADRRIAHATVEVVGGSSVVTDTNGVYQLLGLASGTFIVRVKRLGYVPVIKVLTIAAAEAIRLDVELMPTAQQLDTIATYARRFDVSGFEERRRNNEGGMFITESEIDKRAPMLNQDLFAKVPLVKVGDGGVLTHVGALSPNTGSPFPPSLNKAASSRCSSMQVFVNGDHVADGFSVNTVPPSNIVGIEVYRGPATTPSQFRSFGTNCGTVVIWTK